MSKPSPAELAGQQLFDELVTAAFDVLADGQVTFGEVVQLGGLLASKVNRIAGLSGPEKKDLVVSVVQAALKRVLLEVASRLPAEKKETFETKVKLAGDFAKETLPDVLDVAVQAARGQLDLGKAQKTCWTVVKLAFQCAGKQVPVLPKVLSSEPSPKVQEPVPVSASAAPSPVVPVPLPESPKPEEKDTPVHPQVVEVVESVPEPEPSPTVVVPPPTMEPIPEGSQEESEAPQSSPQKEEDSA
jgi:hypothetical protein